MKLECRHIAKSFGGVRALADVSILFPSQGIVAIIGPNGAGKTTLIDTVTGVTRPDHGQWLADGQDITGLSTERVVQAGIARSFQGIRLLAEESVFDNLALAIPDPAAETLWSAFLHFKTTTFRPGVLKEAARLAALAGMERRLEDPVRSLSYGEQKLVSAVVTAATGAAVLLLDEPLAGVHGEGVSRIIDFTRGLAASGRLIVFIEHDLAAVRRMAETTILMDQGTVLAMGTTSEILGQRALLEAYLG
jgi:branched-chain amino acid transport system ATP-binding protein